LNLNPQPDPLDRALDAAQRAVTLDPSSHFAHEVLADVYFQRQDLDLFFAEAQRALALNPNAVASLGSLGLRFNLAGDERGIAFVRKAMALDPFHSSWLNFAIAHHHLKRGEYAEALAAARMVDLPDLFTTQIYLAAIYAELGHQSEASSALEKLLQLYPGLTIEKLIEERRKWNESDDMLCRWAAALRKAGLPD
jgi:tetratricopeptide (TPR) repeat protein